MKLPSTQIAATFLQSLGVSVVRVARDTKKRPDGFWQQYQTRRADYAEVMEMFSDGAPLGIITGAISGNLTMAEIEGRAALEVPKLRDLAHNSGLGELWDRIDQGWKEISPTGGIHWFYRTPDQPPGRNQKLAQRPSTPEELAAWKQRETEKALEKITDPGLQAKRLERIERSTVNDVLQVLTETRGEGGFVVVAPTAGQYHPLKAGGWRMARGCSPQQVPDLTPAEAEQFLDLLRTLDVPIPGRVANPDPSPAPPPSPRSSGGGGLAGGLSPLDDYEQRTDWMDILIPAGWQLHSTGPQQGERYWTRPGKEVRDGHSASTGRDPDRDRLWVFTSSTEFIPEVPYTKPGAYALLEHGGDHRAAASELRKRGYGRDPEIRAAASPPSSAADTRGTSTRQDSGSAGIDPDRTQTPVGVPTEGNLAPVVEISTKRKKGTAGRTRTAFGNAEMFITEHDSTVRFNRTSGQWYCWEEPVSKWVKQEHDTGNAAARKAGETILGMDTSSEEDYKWQIKSMNPRAIRDMLKSAADNFPHVHITNNDLDNIDHEINTPAGPIDLRTGQLLPPDPAKMHTRSTTVVPDFDMDRTPWLRFLDQTFPDNPGMIDYFKRLAGYTLYGDVSEQIVVFGFGKGGNGKGVAMNLFTKILGDYAATIAPDFLMQTRNEAHKEEVARLQGTRMALATEVDPKAHFDEGKVQAHSGEDTLTGRFMRENTVEFQPSHQIWMTGNHRPKIDSGGGNSMFRRLKMLPFTNDVPLSEQNPQLKKHLMDIAPAIFAWMIEGAVQYHQARLAHPHSRGLEDVEPEEVRAATSAYRAESDSIGNFLTDECQVDDGEKCNRKYLYERYQQWCQTEDERPMGARNFTKALAERGIILDRNSRNMVGGYDYVGVGLLDKSVTFRAENQRLFSPGEKKD